MYFCYFPSGAEAQEHAGKVNKQKGREASNGKDSDCCKSICTSIAADEVVAGLMPSPLKKHALKIQREGHMCTPTKVDVKVQPWYGTSPNFTRIG